MPFAARRTPSSVSSPTATPPTSDLCARPSATALSTTGNPSSAAADAAASGESTTTDAGTGTPYSASAAFASTSSHVMIGPAGGNQPHENTMPTLPVRFCIALEGLWPQQQ